MCPPPVHGIMILFMTSRIYWKFAFQVIRGIEVKNPPLLQIRNKQGGFLWNSKMTQFFFACGAPKTRFLNVSEHSQSLQQFSKNVFWQWTACKGGTLYVLNEQSFLRKCKGGTLYVLNKSSIKFSEMQRGDPLRFDQSPYSVKCKGGTLYVLNKSRIKVSEMQRGDPLRKSKCLTVS